MLSFVIRRILQTIPTVLAVVLVVFVLFSVVPGSIASSLSDDGRGAADPAVVERMKKQLGLDEPVYVRFASYVGKLAMGDLGTSFRTREPVTTMIAKRMWPTLQLIFAAMIFAIVIGVPLGFVAALRPGGLIDMASMVVAVSGLAMAKFWFGLLLMYLFALKLGWLPSFGYGDGSLKYLILPAVTLGVSPMALLARTTRAAVLEVMTADFVRTARSKGMNEFRVVEWHVMRNALVIILTTIGLQFGALMGQAVVVEKLFSWPGIGSLLGRQCPAARRSRRPGLDFRDRAVLPDGQHADRRRLCRDRSQDQIRMKLGTSLIVGGALFALAIFVGVFAPWLAHTDPVMDANLMNAEEPPSWIWWFGTDAQGRDIYSRVVYGARISLTVGIVSQLVNSVIGVTLGLTAGYWGGWWDDVVNGLTNLMLAIPSLIFALAIMAVLGPGLTSLLIALGLTNWSLTCRIARASALVAEEPGLCAGGKGARLWRSAHHDHPAAAEHDRADHRHRARSAWAARCWPKPRCRSSGSASARRFRAGAACCRRRATRSRRRHGSRCFPAWPSS